MGKGKYKNKKYQRKRTLKERINLNPEIGRGMSAIILFILGVLSALSFFSLAGVVGKFIDSLLAVSFGQVRYIFPIVIILLAILIIKNLNYEYRPTHWIGSILFILSFNAMVHLRNPLDQMWTLAVQGYGGGLSGFLLAYPMGKYLNFWGGMVILLGLVLISLILLFNTSLARILELHKQFFLTLGWLGKKTVGLFLSFKNKEEKVKFNVKGEHQPITEEDEEEYEDEFEEDKSQTRQDEEEETASKGGIFSKKRLAKTEAEEDEEDMQSSEEEEIGASKPKVIVRDLPPIKLLYTSKEKPSAGDIKTNANLIQDTLQNFGIEVDMGEVRVGPSVSQYSLKPAKGIKLSRITTLGNDLALALAAHPIRIEAPIPGKSLVGIEVPNQKKAMVTLRELFESKEWRSKENTMNMALGKDVSGAVAVANLPKMPHLLVAGATGSGKTVCLNTILLSLLYQNTAETLRMIMVDPKRVELTMYNGIPHLLTPVITDSKKTVNALNWTIAEMNRRLDLLSQSGSRDINSYNKSHPEELLPYIIFVIDELADLMSTSAAEVEAGIIRIAQMARAVGIHLIVATQRPSTEVITGLMKANIPGRIAFSVASSIDSRTILDCPGAEKLLGKGDMLYLTAELSKPRRLQGAYISEEELKRVINHLKGDEPPEYDEGIISGKSAEGGTLNMFGGPNDDYDAKFDEAKKIVLESGKASASLLQRRLKVGYARAARLLDELEEAGIVGPAEGAKPREVFTEHLRPEIQEEDDEPQSLGTGGTVFMDDERDEEFSKAVSVDEEELPGQEEGGHYLEEEEKEYF